MPQLLQQNIIVPTGICVERTEEQNKSQVGYIKVHCNDFYFHFFLICQKFNVPFQVNLQEISFHWC